MPAQFPQSPTGGQQFIDSEGIVWVFSKILNVWTSGGVLEQVPLATTEASGLLSYADKALLDSTPAVGGGFGIITDTKLLLQSPSNPTGAITGDIKLRSDSLDITCVGASAQPLTCEAPTFECTANDASPSSLGLQFKLNEKLLKTLYLNIGGKRGKQGKDGLQGDPGTDGFSPGPAGIRGVKGNNATAACDFTGVTTTDIDGISDTAIVQMQIKSDATGSKLLLTKSRTNRAADKPSNKVTVTQVTRGILYPEDDSSNCSYTRLDNWSLVQASGDTSTLDMQLLRLAQSFDPSSNVPVSFNTVPLSTFVGDVIEAYKSKLEAIDTAWGLLAKKYIQTIDTKARGILSDLSGQLSNCEFNLPAADFCVTFNKCPTTSPTAAAASVFSYGDRSGGNTISKVAVGNNIWDVQR